MLVVIGPQWLKSDAAGRRKLDDPDDWVRIEIVEGLQRSELRVVPVLVGGGQMPKGNELPEPLQGLARRNAHEITDKRWDYDVSQLVTALKEALSPVASSKPGTVRSGSALAPGTVFRDRPEAPEMVVIPAGAFMMGSPDAEGGRTNEEGPLHEVQIATPLAVGRFSVTFEEWDACVRVGGCQHRPDDAGWGRGRRPVINVSWQDARAYAVWLSKRTSRPYRLLSEAEWEYAARAGTATAYPWGDDPGQNQANFAGSGSQWSNQTSPVGSFEPNGFGLYDMIGNVWEWVQDCWNRNYAGGPIDGRAWEEGDCTLRVLRGGSWVYGPASCRCACRYDERPGLRYYSIGFRVCCPAPTS
jgi:formylglycine-generating enzyme required for sulfatase activity